jgi:hypothetical protein
MNGKIGEKQLFLVFKNSMSWENFLLKYGLHTNNIIDKSNFLNFKTQVF